jgi:hypothetical protein
MKQWNNGMKQWNNGERNNDIVPKNHLHVPPLRWMVQYQNIFQYSMAWRYFVVVSQVPQEN